MRTIWNIVESLLSEVKQYRGEHDVRYKDLHRLIKGNEQNPGMDGGVLDPKGAAFDTNYKFNPQVWKDWTTDIRLAIGLNTSSGDQHHGAPQGGQMNKQNYGGRVSFDAGKARTDFERQPSAMDKYDLVMIGDITKVTNKKGIPVEKGIVTRVAYSPAIGSSDERQARLTALLSGQQAPELKRRPQPEVPGVDDFKQNPEPVAVPRLGQYGRPKRGD